MSTSLIQFDGHPSMYLLIESLKRELYNANRQLNEATEALRMERQKTAAIERGVAELRSILSPLYGALQMVFGQVEAMGVTAAVSSESDPRKKAIWDSWKAKLPAGEGRAIDALLLHGAMTTSQLRIHVGCASRTAQNIVQALKSKGLIVKDGAQLRLKDL
jgi:hypothetical protein